MKDHLKISKFRENKNSKFAPVHDLFENLMECVSRLDVEGNYLSVNSSFAEAYGFQPEEMTGMLWKDSIHPRDIEIAEHAYNKMLDVGRAEVEIRGFKKNSSVFYQHIVLVKGLADDKSPICHYYFMRDITERILERQAVSAEADLKSELFQSLIKNIQGVVYRSNAKKYWRFEYLDESISDVLGISPDKLPGSAKVLFFKYTHPDDLGKLKKIINKDLPKNGKYEVVYRIICKDGSIKWLHNRITCIFNNKRELQYVDGVILDITKVKQTELALTESQKMLSSAFESSPDSITISRLKDGAYLSVNNSFTRISGYSQEEVVGKSSLDIGIWVSKKDSVDFINLLEKKGHCTEHEFEIRTKSGKIISVLISGSIIHVDSEPCLFAMTRDITEQKREEENLLQIAKGLSSKLGEHFFTSLVEHLAQSLAVEIAFVASINPENINIATTIALYTNGKHVDNLEYSLVGTPCEMVVGHELEPKIVSDSVQELFPEDKILADMEAESYAGVRLIDSSDGVMGLIAVIGKQPFKSPEKILSTLQIFASRASAELERMRSHRELVNSEENFRRAIAYSPDVITIVTVEEEELLEVNEGFCKTTGYKREEVLGNPIRNLWQVPQEREQFIKTIKQEGSVKNFQHAFVGKGGKLIDGSVSSVIIDYQGQQCIFSVAHDITDLKEAERALAASEEKFRSAFGGAPVGIYLADTKGEIFQTNNIVLDTLGYKEKEFLGKTFVEITHPDDVEISLDNFQSVLSGFVHSYDIEKRFLKKSGEAIWMHLHLASVRDEEDRVLHIISHIIDISEQKLSAERLERDHRALRVLNEGNYGLTHIEDEDILLQYICEVIIDTGGYRFAWVGYAQDDKHKTVQPMTCAGYEAGYLEQTILWSDKPKGRGPAGVCIRTAIPMICRNTSKDPAFKPWRKAASERNYQSCVAFPLIVESQAIGTLMIYSSEVDAFDVEEVKLLGNLAENLAFGIQGIRLKKESQHAEAVLRSSEEKFRKTFGNAPVGMVILNSDGVLIEANQAALKLSGLTEQEFIGGAIDSITHPDDLENSIKHFKDLWSGKIDSYQLEKRYLHKDGHIIHCILHGSMVRDENNVPLFMVGQVEDITDKKHFNEMLAASAAKFKMLYHDTPAMFFNIARNGTILEINEYGAEQLGYSVEELQGKSVESVIHKNDRKSVKTKLENCFREPEKVHRWEVRKCCKDGREVWTRETVRVVDGEDGSASLFIVCEDITETFRLSQQLSHQAIHDSLTGLVNRAEFERRLERLIEENRSNSSNHALCYLDLDQFKVINDTSGHLAGDELLRQLSEVLLPRIRKRDTFARLGGDEFGVLMEHCDLNHARRVADNIRETVEDYRFVWQKKKFVVGVSIGLVPIMTSSGNVHDVLSAADAACYAAKDAGRNRIHIYSSDDKTMTMRRGEMRWVNRINRALEEDRFRLYCQKITSVKGLNEGDHYELLLRMSDKEGKLVPPGAFLPAAERFGLITKVDQWVVNKALTWLAQHPAKLNKLHVCAINLSGQTLGNNEFLLNLVKTLDESQVPPEKICFEITETSAVANLANAIRFMKKLHEKGCLFALDDFGSGVSSFGYLKNLPVDYLKIDGSFVKDIRTDKIDRAMVKSITEIGQIMGKKTIAEFVENDAILRVLKKLGVDYAQGYGIGKPRALYRVRKSKRKKTGK